MGYPFKAWSHSAITNFETCALQYYHLKVAKDVDDPPNEASLWGRRVHTALEHRLKHGTPLGEGFDQYEPVARKFEDGAKNAKLITETRLCVDKNLAPVSWFDKQAWCRAIIDVGVLRANEAIIADYKTGKRKPDNDQLRLFAAMAFQHYSNVEKISTAFIWLKSGQADREEFKREDKHLLWQEFMPRVARMERAHQDDKWLANPNGLCAHHCRVPKSKCKYSGREG